MSEPVTEMSDLHRELTRLLQNWGLELMDEVPFPPFQVDIYVPQAHVAIEADGPQHNRRADERRDEKLFELYDLPVIHVTDEAIAEQASLRYALLAHIGIYMQTAEQRLTRCKAKLPWI